MSAPLRFLGFAILAYVGLRTASSALALEPMSALPSPPVADAVAARAPAMPTDLGTPTVSGYGYGYGYPPMAMAGPPQPYQFAPYTVPAMMMAPRQSQPLYRTAPMPYPVPPDGMEDEPASPSFGYASSEAPALDQWPAIGTSGPFSVGALQETPSWGKDGARRPRLSRWSLDAWALARQPRSGLLPIDDPAAGLNPGLASSGSLGGSQAGLRLTYRPLPSVGLHLRTSTALMPQGRGGQTMAGGEGAIGVSVQPLSRVPIRLLAERRQRLGPALGGGRNAFALLAEGGLYGREIAYGIQLDGYGQAGIVGTRSRDLFADGALAATYAFLPRAAIGGGIWGGVQPGLSRIDAGPRLSYQLSPRLRVHLDYRFRMTGNADPPSGPALTLSGGF